MSVRFAPSPTGAFHVGNFRTAWISHWWSRQLGMPWILRIEDIDKPRNVPGAMERQISEMEALGLKADRRFIQSHHELRHCQLFERAIQTRQVYPCYCSRREVRDALEGMASAPHRTPPIYNGHCRNLSSPPAHSLPSLAWRFKCENPSGTQDFIIGRTAANRSDFAPAYHWACAIDDYDGQHALLVRASDLASAAEQQRAIQRWLALVEGRPVRYPAIFHCALVTQNSGERLEKRTQGVTLPELFQRGFSKDSLLALFQKSFSASKSEFSPEAIWGETSPSLTLRELGLDG